MKSEHLIPNIMGRACIRDLELWGSSGSLPTSFLSSSALVDANHECEKSLRCLQSRCILDVIAVVAGASEAHKATSVAKRQLKDVEAVYCPERSAATEFLNRSCCAEKRSVI